MVSANPKNIGPQGDSVRYPKDRRQAIWIGAKPLVWSVLLVTGLVAAAWCQYFVWGLPHIHVYTLSELHQSKIKFGFPVWLRITHYANFC